jgi:hypothetical protein
MRSVIKLLPVIWLAGCGTVQHSVNVQDEAAFHPETKVAVDVVSNRTGETFDVDVEGLLRDAMNKKLAEQDLTPAPDSQNVMTMNVSIIEYRKGDAFKRWLWPGYGSTVLVVEATLLDAAGAVDATAQANRSVDAGGAYTIGAWENIFDDVAGDLVADLKMKISGQLVAPLQEDI